VCYVVGLTVLGRDLSGCGFRFLIVCVVNKLVLMSSYFLLDDSCSYCKFLWRCGGAFGVLVFE
jgi:hypothetical protein